MPTKPSPFLNSRYSDVFLKWMSRINTFFYRRNNGHGLGSTFQKIPVALLTTTGRKSGEPRESPMFYVPLGNAWVVVASNAASKRPPAWWLNLEAKPEADAFVGGEWHAVRARRATDEERDEVWPRLVEMYSGYEHYQQIAMRDMPVVVLEPTA